MGEATFNGQKFLTKEAAPNPKTLVDFFSKKNKVAPAANKKPSGGTFLNDATESAVNKDSINIFTPDQVADKANDIKKREGTGSFLADGALGLTKRIAKGTKEPIDNAVVKVKDVTEKGSTAAGKAIAGKNPDSMWGKMWSNKVTNQVGDVKNADGSTSRILKEDRQPSVVAPVQNAAKFLSPFLATAFVAEKLYPEVGQGGRQATYETEQTKQASSTNDSTFDESVVESLNKHASMHKIAELEGTISKYAQQLEESNLQKEAAEEKLAHTLKEKEHLQKIANDAREQVFEKEAAYEELRLRTIAQKRSKTAVDLGELMLDKGLIKQAELDSTIDELMTCDERTIKMYQNMTKQADNQVESLESLAILGEYKDNEKLARSSRELGGLGLSRRGQSIGDAARDLNK